MERIQYNKIFDNGVLHIEASKLLASEKMYGFAISHLILDIEELMKYIVVMTKFVNHYDFSDVLDGKKNLVFSSHATKHDLFKEFQEAISDSFSNRFFNMLISKQRKIVTDEDYSDILKNRFKEWGLFFRIAGHEMNIPNEQRIAFFEWLKKANDTKNKGYYANQSNGNSITVPDKFAIDDYETALTYANSLLMQTTFMKSVDLSNEEFKAYQKQLSKS